MSPPIRLIYQNAIGTWLSDFFSEAIHCTTQRPKNSPWPRNPMASQICSIVMVIMEPSGAIGERRTMADCYDQGVLRVVYVPPFSRAYPPVRHLLRNAYRN